MEWSSIRPLRTYFNEISIKILKILSLKKCFWKYHQQNVSPFVQAWRFQGHLSGMVSWDTEEPSYNMVYYQRILHESHGLLQNDATHSMTMTCLTHWGRVTHICISKLTVVGSDNGLPPSRRQAIIWTNDGILLIGPLGINLSEILIEIENVVWKMVAILSHPQCVKIYRLDHDLTMGTPYFCVTGELWSIFGEYSQVPL